MAVNPIEELINRIYAEQGSNNYWDAGLGAAVENARLSLADVNRGYGRGVEEAGISYNELARDLLRRRDESLEQNTGQFAGQGILRSGIFAKEQGRVGESYQRGLGDAATRRTSMLADLENNRLSGFNDIQRMLRGEQSNAVARAQQRRAEEAERQMQAQFQAQQLALQQQALENQRSQAEQQLALARSSGGGGGGGGGYYTLEDLFGPMPQQGPKQKLQTPPGRIPTRGAF